MPNYLTKSSRICPSAFYTAAASLPKRVGTHNGKFHCDEALGCFIFRLTSKFFGAEIVLTRNLEVLDTLDAVLDVGGVYDPSRDRFDHHRKGFEEILGHRFTTKLSSAGLVYKHYGVEVIAKAVQLDEGHPNVRRLFLAVYKSFVEAVDATDNGINQYQTDQPPIYVNSRKLSSRVNLDWDDADQSPEKENLAFQCAMLLAGSEFMDSIYFHIKSWLPARSIVMEVFLQEKSVDSSGEIMLLIRSCPLTLLICIRQWKLHIFEFDLEVEMKIDPTVKYVICQDDRNEKWRVQSVAASPDKFESGRLYHLLGGV